MPLVNYKWNTEYEEKAKKIISEDTAQKDEQTYVEGDKRSKEVWDLFYKNHQTKFFKPRKYLEKEFLELPEVSIQKERNFVFSELGCGVGDTIFPLLDKYPNVVFQGCDLSSQAIQYIRQKENYVPDRFRAEVCDLVNDPFPSNFEQSHLVTLIFCLSAIAPENYAKVAKKIYDLMAPGAVLFFRDYGRYDHKQINLATKKGRKLKDNFYQKEDGIRVYYFEDQEVSKIFQSVGFEEIECRSFLRYLENRKKGQEFLRVWIQGRFRKPGTKIFESKLNLAKTEQQDEEDDPE